MSKFAYWAVICYEVGLVSRHLTSLRATQTGEEDLASLKQIIRASSALEKIINLPRYSLVLGMSFTS